MKFNKRNILFKMMFVVLIAFICFNVNEVKADDLGSNHCRYSYKKGYIQYFFSNGSLSTTTSNNVAVTNMTPAAMSEMKKLIFEADGKIFCPNEVHFIRSGPSIRIGNLDYVQNIKNKDWPNGEMGTMTLQSTEKSDYTKAYDSTKNPGVCIHTSNNTEFASVYQMANNLKTATVYDDKYASKANQIDKYVKNNINKAFCDTEQFKVLQGAINNWNTVVSKDPSANKAQKDKAQEQAENTNKNIEEIISNMQNSANISIPNDNPVQNTCKGLIDEDLKRVIDIVLNVVRIVVPILLIVLIAVDFGQVVISNDKEAMPKAVSKAIKRGIAAIVIFFIPFLIDLIIDWLNTYSGINGAANCIK